MILISKIDVGVFVYKREWMNERNKAIHYTVIEFEMDRKGKRFFAYQIYFVFFLTQRNEAIASDYMILKMVIFAHFVFTAK